MIRFPLRSKVAAIVVLFFLGTFAGQLRAVLDSITGKVDRGARVTADIRNAVDGVGDAATEAAEEANRLRAELQALYDQVKAGTASPAQVQRIETIVRELDRRPGAPGPPGPAGVSGPPGPPAATSPSPPSSSSTSTTRGGTTSTTRTPPATTTTRPTTTTTTRCLVGLGRLLKAGCS